MDQTSETAAASEELRERLEAMRDQLILGLAAATHLDAGFLQLLGTVGAAGFEDGIGYYGHPYYPLVTSYYPHHRTLR